MQTTRYASLRIALLAAMLTVSAGCAAQPASTSALSPVGADAPPPPVAGSPVPPPPPGAGPGLIADAASVATMQGTLARFLTNPDGDVDGFMTDNGTLVRFPPHMSAQLTSAVRRGDLVQVRGIREEGGSIAAQRIADTRSGQQ